MAALPLADGATAPASASPNPLAATVAGINVDRTTIPQLERAMNQHRLSAVQLVRFYAHRIEALNPKLHAVITVSPTAGRRPARRS
jgi:amidase